MANSFGDQFLKAGLVNKSQHSKAKKSKHKQIKQENKQKVGVINEAALAVKQQATEKTARDAALNLQKKEAAERKAIQAQIRQLVEMNRISCEDGEVGYNFQDGSAIKKIFVTEEIHSRLGSGILSIVRCDTGYEVIPTVVAEKIRLRDESCIITNRVPHTENGGEDPYADYQVPDDLMW